MPMHVGTAPDSWGVWFPTDPLQTPWSRYLDEVVQAGYDAVELGPFGYLPTEPARVADELGRRSLRLTGATISVELSSPAASADLPENAPAICDVLEHLDAHYLVVLDHGYFDRTGAITGPRELDDNAWQNVAEVMHRLGAYTQSRGIHTVLHPHADTTIQFESQIERFLDTTDPGLVNLCLDVGHHAYAGGEPASFFRKHHARVPYLHLKDVNTSITERTRQSSRPMSAAIAEGGFTDLGQGTVDLLGIRDVALSINYDGWAIVEQDMYPAPFDKPLPIAARNREFLRNNNFG
jgi:inosose dehydratase